MLNTELGGHKQPDKLTLHRQAPQEQPAATIKLKYSWCMLEPISSVQMLKCYAKEAQEWALYAVNIKRVAKMRHHECP